MSELIAEKLIDIESVQFSFNEHFTLTSGLKSPVYVDCRKIISFVKEREFIMDAAVNYIEKNKLEFDLVAGGETAGIPYSAFISEKIKKPMIYIRKKPKGFGKNQQIEGSFKENQVSILIEDNIFSISSIFNVSGSFFDNLGDSINSVGLISIFSSNNRYPKNDFIPESFIFSFCLNPPLALK